MAAFDLGGQGQFASRVFWNNATIKLPSDTVSEFLLEYSNTTITSSTTIYGNTTSLSASIASQVNQIELGFSEGVGNYGNFAPFVLANGTNGATLGGVTNFAYPTPYFAVAGLSIFTNLPSAGCPLNPPHFLSSLIVVGGPDALPDGVGVITFNLTSTYYSLLPATAAPGDFGFFDLDTKLFSAFLASDTSLLSYVPDFKSCSYLTFGIGPPALQIAAMALTTTAKLTIKETGPYPTNPPAPGSTIRPSVAPQTTTLPQGTNQGSSGQESPNQGSPVQDPPNQGASNTDPADKAIPQEGNLPTKAQSSRQGVGSEHPGDQGSGPVNSIHGSGDPSQTSNILQAVPTAKNMAAPAIFYDGTNVQPNEASQYNFPGIGTISPGGPAVTTNGMAYSLAASATTIISNRITIPSIPVVNAPAISLQPSILSFAGILYTMDASSRFVIAGQTVTPAGPAITVSGTQISVASGATAAVIGTKTVSIIQDPANDIPIISPVLKFAGSTYTAGTSGFVIEGQTLPPGANIEVHGTPISYPFDGGEVVIGTSTEPLSYATITPPVVAAIFTFDGSTYTADSSSQIIIDGQTLMRDNIITLSGTPISYAAAGSGVIIGTSTQLFSYAEVTPTAKMIMFDEETYTADASSAFIIDGHTLAPGHVITISGTPISYASGGTDVVVGTSTEAVSIGGLIMSGFGGSGPANTGVITFTGGTMEKRRLSSVVLGAAVALSLYSALA